MSTKSWIAFLPTIILVAGGLYFVNLQKLQEKTSYSIDIIVIMYLITLFVTDLKCQTQWRFDFCDFV